MAQAMFLKKNTDLKVNMATNLWCLMKSQFQVYIMNKLQLSFVYECLAVLTNMVGLNLALQIYVVHS